MPKAGRTKPCDNCRRRKTRCVTENGSRCAYCTKNDFDCVFSDPPKPTILTRPTRIEVNPLETPQPSEPGLSFIPQDYSGGALIGTTADQDPYLVQFYQSGPDNVSRFVDQGIHMVERPPDPYLSAVPPVAFSVFRKPQASGQSKYLDLHKSQVHNAVEPYRERLLALYFKFIDWTYPAVDKHTFYQNYYFKKDRLHSGLLAGMLAIACIYWKYDSQLCVKPMPKQLASQLWEQCAICIDEDILAPTLETVQALLLYLQRRLARGDTNEQHAQAVWLGKLVSVAHSLGLHLDCTNWSVSDHEKQVRRRLWALTFIMDKWMALTLGRPSLLHSSRIAAQPFESIHPQEQLFVQVYHITELLSDVLDDLYSPAVRYSSNYDPAAPEVLSSVELYLSKLEQWKIQLPEDMSSMQGQADGYCRNGVLHLLSLCIEVILWRVVLVPCNMTHPQFPMWRRRARETIQKIIVYTSEITYSHLHAFWPASCPLAFSTLAHFVFYYYVQSSPEEQKELNESFRRWLWALRVLANTWPDGTGLATLRMDAVFHMGKSSVIIPPPTFTQPLQTTPYDTSSMGSASASASPLDRPDRPSIPLEKLVPVHPSPPRGSAYQTQHFSDPPANIPVSTSHHANMGPPPVQTFYGQPDDTDPPLVHQEIIPINEQQPEFTSQEYYTAEDPTIYDNISFDDLVKDSLHDLLMENIFEETYQ